MNFIRSRKLVRPVMAVLLWLAVLPIAVRAQGESATSPRPIEYQRIYVPANRPNEWPQSGFEFAPQIELEEFERLVGEFSRNQNQVGDTVPVLGLTYQARLEGRMLAGTADFSLPAGSDAAPGFVSLKDSNLLYFNEEERLIESPDILVGGFQQQHGAYLREAFEAMRLDWTYQASVPSPRELAFQLQLVFSPKTDFYLELPPGWEVKLEEGVLLEGPDPSDLAESRVWHLAPQWEGKLHFRLVASEVDANARFATAIQRSSYELRNNVCALSSQYSLYAQPQTALDLTLPESLVLSRVLLNGQEIPEPDVHDVGDGNRQLRIPQAAFPADRTATITLEGVAPLSLEEYSRVDLPIIVAASQPTESHVVAVELDQGIHLSYCDLKNAQQVTFVPHNSLGRSNLKFRLYDSTAAIGLQLYRRQLQIESTIINQVTVNDLVIEGNCLLTMSQNRGTTDTVELPLADGWHAEEIVLVGSEEPTVLRWEETSRDGHRVLRIDNAGSQPRLRFTLRRPRDNDFGNLRIADFRPFSLPLGKGNSEWVSVKPDSGFELQLEPEGQVARVAPNDLPPEVAEWFGSNGNAPAFEVNGRSDLQHLVRVSRTRAAYDAQIVVEATLEEASFQENAVIRLSGSGLLPETLFVWSTRRWPGEVRWETPNLVPIGWTAITTSASETASERDPYYIYELRLPAENAFPLVLHGSFPLENSPYEAPLLLAVPSAETRQSGKLSLRVPDACQVTARPALLRKVYANLSPPAAPWKLQKFEYRPVEIRRLAESRKQLLECDWSDSLALPEIFSPESRHAVSIENDGRLRYTSSWNVVVSRESRAVFDLPEGAQVETVQWNGEPWHRWQPQEAGTSVSVDLPGTSGGGLLEVCYQRGPGSMPLVRKVDADFAEARFPTSSQQATFSLGNRLDQFRYPHVTWAGLGSRLRHALWTGLFQSEPAVSGETPAAAEGPGQAALQVHHPLPKTGLWIVHRGLLLPLSLGLLLVGLSVGWRYFPVRPKWLLTGVLGLVAVAVWMPVVLAPLSSALFLGLTLGGLGGFLAIPSTAAPVRRASSSTITATSLLLVAMTTAGFGEVDSLLAAEDKTTQVVFPVLIPIDSDREPIGQAYLPQPFFEQLVAASQDSDHSVPGYVLEGIRYEVAVDEAGISVTTRIELITTEDSQSVSLPFDPELGGGLTTALVDGGILPDPFDADEAELNLSFRDAGRHAVEIRSTLALEEESESSQLQRLRIATPPFVSTAVTLTDSQKMATPTVSFSGRSVSLEPSNIRQTIPLGTTAGFELAWSSPALQTQFDIQEFDLLEYSADEVRLRVRLKLSTDAPSAGPLVLEADSRLNLITPQASPWKMEAESSEEAASTRRYTISALSGAELPGELELLFTLDGAQKVGQLRFPNVSVKNGTVQRRWVAVAAADQLQVQSQAQSRVNVRSQEEFLREWGDAIPDFRFAVASVDAQPLDWLISTRPIATRGVADFKHRLLLDESGYRFEMRAQIETYSGDPQQYVVQLMPDAQVDSVQYLVDGLLRPTQWHYEPATGELGILLLNTANGLQDLTIRGRTWHAPDEPELVLRPIQIREVVTNSCQVQLFRDHSILVRSMPGNNLLPMQEESLEGLEHDLIPVGQWEVPEPGEPVAWQIIPNEVIITGDLLTVAHRAGGSWRIALIGKLDVRSGNVETMQWLVPKEITLDPESLDGFVVHSRLLPDQSAYVYELTPRMPLGSSISFEWSGKLETAPGQRTTFSSIQLIGQPRLGQFVAVPNQVDNQEVLWSSGQLRPLAVTGRWLSANTPQGHQLLRATRPDFTCEMLQRPRRNGQPLVDALETTLLVDDQGSVFGVTRAAIIPQGNHELELNCPEDVEILATSVEFGRQSRLPTIGESQVTIPLQSNSLPQVVEIAFRTHLQNDSGQGSYQLFRPHLPYPSSHPELLRIGLPLGMSLRDVSPQDHSAWSQNQVAVAFRLQDASRDAISGLGAAEIERWNKLRMDQAFSAVNAFQELLRAEGASTESAQAAIAEVLGDKTAEIESWPVSDGEDSTFAALASAAEMESAGFQYFLSEVTDGPLRFRATQRRSASIGPPLLITLLCLVAGAILFLNLAIPRRLGQEIRQWIARNPQVCGILIGLFWWLFLPPHGIGLLIIAAVVWASIPVLPRSLLARP